MRFDFVTCVNRKVTDANPVQITTTPSPLKLHHDATWTMKNLQSIGSQCKVTWLPLCILHIHSYNAWLPSWHHLNVNLMPLRLQRDHHSNKLLPIKCHLSATVSSLCQINTTQPIQCHWHPTVITIQPIKFESSATWLPLLNHSAIGLPVNLCDYKWITTQPIQLQFGATWLQVY